MRNVFQSVIDGKSGEGASSHLFELGNAVMAGHPPSGWERRYSGKISAVNADGTYEVTFDDGEKQTDV